MDITDLMLGVNNTNSNDYKEGWNNAICFMNDNFCIRTRAGRNIQISFNIAFDEEKFEKRIMELINEQRP